MKKIATLTLILCVVASVAMASEFSLNEALKPKTKASFITLVCQFMESRHPNIKMNYLPEYDLVDMRIDMSDSISEVPESFTEEQMAVIKKIMTDTYCSEKNIYKVLKSGTVFSLDVSAQGVHIIRMPIALGDCK